MSDDVKVHRPDAPRDATAVEIHPAVEVQQERVAELRGLCGQLAAALKDIRDAAAPGTTPHAIAEQALAKYREAA